MLELLTGAPVVEENRDPLTLYIDEMADDGESVDTFYDKTAGNWKIEIADSLYDLSVSCREYKPKKRPPMEIVSVMSRCNLHGLDQEFLTGDKFYLPKG